jgi:hypothetical protein
MTERANFSATRLRETGEARQRACAEPAAFTAVLQSARQRRFKPVETVSAITRRIPFTAGNRRPRRNGDHNHILKRLASQDIANCPNTKNPQCERTSCVSKP